MNTNETQVSAELESSRVNRATFFSVYQDLLEEKGFDENKRPRATMKDLQALFPQLEPLTVKQKLYAVLKIVNANGKNNYPTLPSGEPRKQRQSKKAEVDAELLRLAETRKVFDQVD